MIGVGPHRRWRKPCWWCIWWYHQLSTPHHATFVVVQSDVAPQGTMWLICGVMYGREEVCHQVHAVTGGLSRIQLQPNQQQQKISSPKFGGIAVEQLIESLRAPLWIYLSWITEDTLSLLRGHTRDTATDTLNCFEGTIVLATALRLNYNHGSCCRYECLPSAGVQYWQCKKEGQGHCYWVLLTLRF